MSDKKAYFLNLKHPAHYPICKALERKGFEIIDFVYNPFYDNLPKKLQTLEDQKVLDYQKETYEISDCMEHNKKMQEYFESTKFVSFNEVKILDKDEIFCFNESDLIYSTHFKNSFMSRRQAFLLSCKHIHYRKLNIPFKKVYSLNDLHKIPFDQFILKPSIFSGGKINVFEIKSNDDKEYFIKNFSYIFNNKKLFIAMPQIKYILRIWVFCIFDANSNPHLLWFVTENGSSTKSVFENQLCEKLIIIGNKLNIKNWMTFSEFLLDENGEFHFIDLNPRLPGNDHWYELAYKYLTGKSLSKIIVDLILDKKIPEIIKNDRYILEKEYDKNIVYPSNVKIWPYTDLYKKKPVLFFK